MLEELKEEAEGEGVSEIDFHVKIVGSAGDLGEATRFPYKGIFKL